MTDTTVPPMQRTGIHVVRRTAEKDMYQKSNPPHLTLKFMKTQADREMGERLARILSDGRPYSVQLRSTDNFTDPQNPEECERIASIETEIWTQMRGQAADPPVWFNAYWFYEVRLAVLLLDPYAAHIGDELPGSALVPRAGDLSPEPGECVQVGNAEALWLFEMTQKGTWRCTGRIQK